MDVTIIGTGNMARGIGRLVLDGGHGLTVVGKDRERAEAVAGDLGGEVSTAVSGDQLGGDVIVLAVYYPDAREAVEQYSDQLAGKTVVDITNPVNDSFDGLVVPSTARPPTSWPRSRPMPASSRLSTPPSPRRPGPAESPGSRSMC